MLIRPYILFEVPPCYASIYSATILTPLLLVMRSEGYLKCDEGQRYITRPFVSFPLTSKGVKISWYSKAEYLEVIIDNKVSWRPHMGYAVAKVKALYSLLFGKFSLRNRRQLYLSYIQSIMT
jgi:hypothetical protein